MKEILKFFKEIVKIEHCSYKTEKLKEYLIEKSKEYNYLYKTDKANNILIYPLNKTPKICIQAHYDMVCVGEAPNIEIIEKDGLLKAKDSSLGADNGIAIAIMLSLIKEGVDAEFLFTNDEEVGLIGAKKLELNIKSKYLLNLDSEDEASVFIGCAGGVDLKAIKELDTTEAKANFYEVEISNLPGGHSGVDIDKNIPNAIIELLKILKNSDALLCTIKGGVATNAIPSSAKAIVSANIIKSYDNLKVKKLNKQYICYNFNYSDILNSKNGVLSYNSDFNIPQNSLNLGLINLKESKLSIDISMRSMSNNNLEELSNDIASYYKNRGYNIKLFDKYPAWKPEINNFTQIVKRATQKIYGNCKELVIHAGLECGILSQKYPNVKLASIGPNIKYPHSTNEFVEIKSVEKTYKVIKEILSSI